MYHSQVLYHKRYELLYDIALILHMAFKNIKYYIPVHTSLEVWHPQTKWTLNATYLGSFGTYLGFISYILEKKLTSLFGGPVVHRQKNPPNLGWMGCACWLPSPKRLFFFSILQYKWDEAWMGPKWPQVGGDSCSFFLLNHTFKWSVIVFVNIDQVIH